MIVANVPAQFLAHAWIEAAPLIEKALKFASDKLDIVDVFERLSTGRYSLWVVTEGETIVVAMITEVMDYPAKRTLGVPFCGGHVGTIDKWLPDILTALDAHARHNGCQSVEVWGRPGWERLLKDYHKRYVCLEKDLTDV
jgi:hypothetical protein